MLSSTSELLHTAHKNAYAIGDFKAIRKEVDVPLVLHGASGLPEAIISQSIQLGVCKFNVNTEVREAYLDVLKSSNSLSSPDLLDLMQQAIAAIQAVVSEKLQIFGSVSKAHLHTFPLS